MSTVKTLIPGALVLALALGGCAGAGPGAGDIADVAGAPSGSPAGRDRTVRPAAAWDAPGPAATIHRADSIADVEGDSDIEAIAAASDLAVRGTVRAVSFTHVGGQPFTLSDVLVGEVLAGDAAVGDAITIVQPGGIIPLRVELDTGQIDASRLDPDLTDAEIDATYNAHHWNGEEYPVVGAESVYFLTEMTADRMGAGSARLLGAYFRGWSDDGQFRVVRRGDRELLRREVAAHTVTPGDPDTGATFTAERLRDVAEQRIGA